MNKKFNRELLADVAERLITHLQTRTDVQNIDLMNLSGFCRNCLSKWYLAAAEKKNISLDYNQSRELVYGMPYDEWKSKYQKEATEEQIKDFNKAMKEVVNKVNRNLSVIEQVRKFILIDHEFTIENSMMTPSMKVRRFAVKDKYGDQLEDLY